MKIKIILLLLISTSATFVFGQSLRYSLAQPYVGLSAYSVQHNDALSFTGNQAALASSKKAGVGVYGERRFMLSETGNYTLGASVPTSLGNFGLQVNYAGFSNFNEQKIGLAYARRLGKLVDVGVQFNYYGYRVPTYGNASTVNVEAGAIMHLTEKLHAGVHVYNPVGGKLAAGGALQKDDEKLASAFKMGMGYDVSENFLVSGEIVKEEDKAVSVVAGFQYRFAGQFFTRAGFISESGTAYAGAGVGFNNLRLDLAGSYHPQLGFSPGILLIVNFKSKAE